MALSTGLGLAGLSSVIPGSRQRKHSGSRIPVPSAGYFHMAVCIRLSWRTQGNPLSSDRVYSVFRMHLNLRISAAGMERQTGMTPLMRYICTYVLSITDGGMHSERHVVSQQWYGVETCIFTSTA